MDGVVNGKQTNVFLNIYFTELIKDGVNQEMPKQ